MAQEKNKVELSEQKIREEAAKKKYRHLAKCLQSSDREICLMGMRMIGEVNAVDFEDGLVQVVIDGADAEYRKAAVRALGEIKSEKARFVVVRRLETEKDPGVIDEINKTLIKLRNEKAEGFT